MTTPSAKSPKPWWANGVRFQCQGSGKCCVSRGGYGFVYVTLEDRRRFARHFGIPTAAFTKKYCERERGIWKLKDFNEDCRFLEGGACGVYEARPTQCRTWPFWPEVMNARVWKKEVVAFCPGVGKGRQWSEKEIVSLLKIQAASEAEYGS